MWKNLAKLFRLNEPKPSLDITMVFYYNDNDVWIGECLDYDIGCQGITLGNAIERLIKTVKVEYDLSIATGNGEPFNNIIRTPEYMKNTLLKDAVVLVINEEHLRRHFNWKLHSQTME